MLVLGLYWLIWTTGGWWWLAAAGGFFCVTIIMGQSFPCSSCRFFTRSNGSTPRIGGADE